MSLDSQVVLKRIHMVNLMAKDLSYRHGIMTPKYSGAGISTVTN